MVIFYSYVSLPEGMCDDFIIFHMISCNLPNFCWDKLGVFTMIVAKISPVITIKSHDIP